MTNDRTTVSRLLFLHAQTPVHPGAGTALGVIDLPVQRERHTLWPTVPGSSLKGILRDICRPPTDAEEDYWLAAFGPETGDAEKHAGALAVTDARILAFPVRSLRGVFAWITCPSVLNRLRRDAMLAGAGDSIFRNVPQPGPNEVFCDAKSDLLVDGATVVLEEFELQRVGEDTVIAEWIATAATDELTRAQFLSHLVILHDDHFTHFVRHATEVVARIGLDYERKTVRKGALFYQEFLPAETMFYSVVFANSSRRQGVDADSGEVMKYVIDCVPPVLQIGGDETTGKGICAARFWTQRTTTEMVQ